MSSTPKKIALVTGSNKGIGLGFVRHLVEKYQFHRVIATARNPQQATELQQLANEHQGKIGIYSLDVSDENSIQTLYDEVTKNEGNELDHIDVIINNSGVLYHEPNIDAMDPEQMLYAYKVNCIGPMLMNRTFKPLVLATKHDLARFVNVSTRVASIADNGSGRNYAYRCSKIALNMANTNFALELENQNAISLLVHPGLVYTSMTKGFLGEYDPNKHRTPEQASQDLLNIALNAKKEDNGKFYSWDQSIIPW